MQKILLFITLQDTSTYLKQEYSSCRIWKRQFSFPFLHILKKEHIEIDFTQNMTKKERYQHIISWFSENVPVAETELAYKDPFSLLVAVILSAQCTDKRVNQITPLLLEKFPDAKAMKKASQEEIFSFIKSCSYPNNKAKHIKAMATMLDEVFDGKVPSDILELQKLPGVGRKTANVIASVVFQKPAMAVDTHVFRVSERLGLTSGSKTPFETEMELIKYIPEKLIPLAHHWLILHGRYICLARKPKCNECGLKTWCRYYSNEVKPSEN